MEGTDPQTWFRRKTDAEKGNIAPYAMSFYKLPIITHWDGLYFFDGNFTEKMIRRHLKTVKK